MQNEDNVSKILLNEFASTTMFIIAHRISTVMHCDRIIVLDQGSVVEFGHPEELLKIKNGYFKSVHNKMVEENTG